MRIKRFPDEHLSIICKPVTRVTDKHRTQAGEMHVVMKQSGGVGLSAPQVGLTSRIIVINTLGYVPDGRKLTMYNPEVTNLSEELNVDQEGCLSFPSIFFKVERPLSVEVSYLDKDNIKRIESFSGLTARAILHEIDHLDGVLFNSKAIKEG